jgi:hypothetical protein
MFEGAITGNPTPEISWLWKGKPIQESFPLILKDTFKALKKCQYFS